MAALSRFHQKVTMSNIGFTNKGAGDLGLLRLSEQSALIQQHQNFLERKETAGEVRRRAKTGGWSCLSALSRDSGASVLSQRFAGRASQMWRRARGTCRQRKSWPPVDLREAVLRNCACRASQALERTQAERLDVEEFLRDSIPSEVWFGGFSFSPYVREGRVSDDPLVKHAKVITPPEDVRLPAWSIRGSHSGKGEDALDSRTLVLSMNKRWEISGASEDPAHERGAEVPPSTSIIALAAAALLVLGPVKVLAVLPLSTPSQSVQLLPQNSPLSIFTNSSVEKSIPTLPSELVYTSTTSSSSQTSPPPGSSKPRLPVLIYDPDELLRIPPKEEENKSPVGPQTPVDLAESLQKGCGGPACIATLFRPSAELEGMGIAGAVIFGESTWHPFICAFGQVLTRPRAARL